MFGLCRRFIIKSSSPAPVVRHIKKIANAIYFRLKSVWCLLIEILIICVLKGLIEDKSPVVSKMALRKPEPCYYYRDSYAWDKTRQSFTKIHDNIYGTTKLLNWQDISGTWIFRHSNQSQIAKFMGLPWGPPGSCRTQMGPMLAPWTLLSGIRIIGENPWSEESHDQIDRFVLLETERHGKLPQNHLIEQKEKNHQIVHCLSGVHFHHPTYDGYWSLLFQLPSPTMHRRMPAVPAQGMTQSDMYADRVPVVLVPPVGATSFHFGQRPPSEIYVGVMEDGAGVLPPFGGAALHIVERPPSPEDGGSTMSAPLPYAVSMMTWFRADSRFARSQWETALLCNDVSHWLCTSLESALLFDHRLFNLPIWQKVKKKV